MVQLGNCVTAESSKSLKTSSPCSLDPSTHCASAQHAMHRHSCSLTMPTRHSAQARCTPSPQPKPLEVCATATSTALEQSTTGDISVLVAGPGSADVAAEVTQIDGAAKHCTHPTISEPTAGVSRVFVADIPAVQNQLSENVCQLLQSIQEKECVACS